MKLTDEAVEAAAAATYTFVTGIAWSQIDQASQAAGAARREARAALEAALPHLTDDGVALPVRRDGEDALAAAPSSPHPTREHVAELLSNATRNLDYKQWETPHGMLPFADALLAAGLFGEGATPAIDREALIESVSPVIGLLVRATHPVSPAQRDRITRLNAEKAADAVLALLRGEAQ